MNTGQTSDNVTKADVPAVKRGKKLQKSSKKAIDIKQDEVKIQNAKIEKKVKNVLAQKEVQQIKSKSKPKQTLILNNRKIKRLQEILTKKTQTKQAIKKTEKKQPLTLRDRMMMQLSASRFRFINETLYNSDSSQSKQYFKEDPDAFIAYHDGYKQQIEHWPVNPLDIIISSIENMFVSYYFLFLNKTNNFYKHFF